MIIEIIDPILVQSILSYTNKFYFSKNDLCKILKYIHLKRHFKHTSIDRFETLAAEDFGATSCSSSQESEPRAIAFATCFAVRHNFENGIFVMD